MSQYQAPDMSQADDDSHKRYGSSESETKPSSSSSARKRASRAGTRSVSNLSTAQLERKRANDREAQRAIRQRTKDHIETLERKVAEAETRERIYAAKDDRLRELEQENAYLRSRVPGDAFMMQLPNSESKPTDSAMGHSTQTSPHTRYTGDQDTKPASQTPRHSVSTQSTTSQPRPEAWRQQTHPTVFTPTESTPTSARPEPMRSTSWRNPPEMPATSPGQPLNPAANMEQATRSFSASSTHERPSWPSNMAYQYMADPNQQPSGYTGPRQPMPLQGHQQAAGYPMTPGVGAPPPHQQNYGPPLATPSTEFQNLSMQSPANPNPPHEQAQDHSSYSVQAGHMQAQQGYQGQPQQASMSRTPLAPPFNQPASSTGYPQPGMTQSQHLPMEYQAAPGQPGYNYGQYHGNG